MQKGFTLLELMIVVAIITIIASIAIPSYQRYVRQSYEKDVTANMLTLSNDLKKWQSKAFSYRGFTPSSGWDTTDKKTLYFPDGTSSANYKYKMILVDVAGSTTKSVAATDANGRHWVMTAEPVASGFMQTASKFYLDSAGKRCRLPASVTLSYSAALCDNTQAKGW